MLSNKGQWSLMVALAASVVILVGPKEARAVDRPSQHIIEFLAGHLVADGKLRNFADRSTRSFQVDIHGSASENRYTVVEDTRFSDGERQHKVWTFSPAPDGRYIGHRADLIGDATVTERGNEMELTYTANVPMPGGGSHNLKFDEHFAFAGPTTLTNSVRISFVFIPVGEATLVIRKTK